MTSLDVSAGDAVWSTTGNEGSIVHLVADAVGDGQPQVLDRFRVQGDHTVSAAVAGDLVAWHVEDPGTGTASLYRARFTP